MLQVPPKQVRVLLHEVEREHWFVGGRPDYRAGGQLMVALTEDGLSDLEATVELNVAAGVEVERPTPSECRFLAPKLNPDIHGSVFIPDDAWVDNTALTQAIVRAAKEAGTVFERATVDAVERESGGAAKVYCGGQTHWADWVVVAAGCWSGEISSLPPLPVEPVRRQALAVAG
jgi:glycine/D-amino acid oxidase-like deaminating enzyme